MQFSETEDSFMVYQVSLDGIAVVRNRCRLVCCPLSISDPKHGFYSKELTNISKEIRANMVKSQSGQG